MTPFEELLDMLNVKKGSKFESVVCKMVNELIFDEETTYSDEEIKRIVSDKFKKLFPYI